MTIQKLMCICIPDFENDPSQIRCIECNGAIITDSQKGETICEDCGLVYSEKNIDPSSERSFYNPDQWKERKQTGPFNSVFNFSLSNSTDVNVREMKPSQKWMFRINKWHNNRLDIRYNIGNVEIHRLGAVLEIPYPILEQAMLIYRKYTKKSRPGYSLSQITAACLYYACRVNKLPIPFEELISNCSRPNSKAIQKVYKNLFQDLSLKKPIFSFDPYITRFVSELKLPFYFEKKALELVKCLPGPFISGKNPMGIIAAIIYMLTRQCDIKITLKQLGELMNIRDVTIRTNVKELKEIYKKMGITSFFSRSEYQEASKIREFYEHIRKEKRKSRKNYGIDANGNKMTKKQFWQHYETLRLRGFKKKEIGKLFKLPYYLISRRVNESPNRKKRLMEKLNNLSPE
ncbi:MAG: transcription initiation factor IIB [Promethearchaeota archaeon]